MTKFKALSAALALTLVLGASAFAQGPQCTDPGQFSTPPCLGQTMTPDDSAVPGQIEAPPAPDTVTGFSVADAAISLFESLLPLF